VPSTVSDRDHRLRLLSDGVTDPGPRAHQTLMTGVLPRPGHIVDTAEPRSLPHGSRPDRAKTGGA
jgi:hypothetical protein